MPAITFASVATIIPEDELRARIAAHGFSIANLSYELSDDGRFFEYQMMIRTLTMTNLRRLAETWTTDATVVEFRIAPTGD